MEPDKPEPEEYLVGHVRDALARDERVSDQTLEVTVSEGRVYIRGTVYTAERREAVSEVVAEVLPDHEVHNLTETLELTEDGEVETLT